MRLTPLVVIHHILLVLGLTDDRKAKALASCTIEFRTVCSGKNIRSTVFECTCRHAAIMSKECFGICGVRYFGNGDAPYGLDRYYDL